MEKIKGWEVRQRDYKGALYENVYDENKELHLLTPKFFDKYVRIFDMKLRFEENPILSKKFKTKAAAVRFAEKWMRGHPKG